MNDRLEITEIINRYFAALDQRAFQVETFKKLFAYNAKVERPNGTRMAGPEEICASHSRSLERFRATQHPTSGFIIDLADESKADFRVNLVAMHLWRDGLGDVTAPKQDFYFLAGGVVSGTAIKTSDGWRILNLRNDVAWRRGVGFQEMLNTK